MVQVSPPPGTVAEGGSIPTMLPLPPPNVHNQVPCVPHVHPTALPVPLMYVPVISSAAAPPHQQQPPKKQLLASTRKGQLDETTEKKGGNNKRDNNFDDKRPNDPAMT